MPMAYSKHFRIIHICVLYRAGATEYVTSQHIPIPRAKIFTLVNCNSSCSTNFQPIYWVISTISIWSTSLPGLVTAQDKLKTSAGWGNLNPRWMSRLSSLLIICEAAVLIGGWGREQSKFNVQILPHHAPVAALLITERDHKISIINTALFLGVTS